MKQELLQPGGSPRLSGAGTIPHELGPPCGPAFSQMKPSAERERAGNECCYRAGSRFGVWTCSVPKPQPIHRPGLGLWIVRGPTNERGRPEGRPEVPNDNLTNWQRDADSLKETPLAVTPLQWRPYVPRPKRR
jgi:hypothetical protein